MARTNGRSRHVRARIGDQARIVEARIQVSSSRNRDSVTSRGVMSRGHYDRVGCGEVPHVEATALRVQSPAYSAARTLRIRRLECRAGCTADASDRRFAWPLATRSPRPRNRPSPVPGDDCDGRVVALRPRDAAGVDRLVGRRGGHLPVSELFARAQSDQRSRSAGFVVGYASLSVNQIRQGIRSLAEAITRARTHASSQSAPPSAVPHRSFVQARRPAAVRWLTRKPAALPPELSLRRREASGSGAPPPCGARDGGCPSSIESARGHTLRSAGRARGSRSAVRRPTSNGSERWASSSHRLEPDLTPPDRSAPAKEWPWVFPRAGRAQASITAAQLRSIAWEARLAQQRGCRALCVQRHGFHG